MTFTENISSDYYRKGKGKRIYHVIGTIYTALGDDIM